jgi:NAD(P)-dependent dehydrogenase (short-subunit alcohol dehydrogenase family)
MRRILVIGASGGIGNKVAELLLAEGYSVVGTYFQHPERVENLESSVAFTGEYADLRSIDSIKKLKEKITSQTNELFAVVNCAGIVRFEGGGLDQDLDVWYETLAINLSGNYYLAKVFSDNLEENGRFLMISSTDSYFGGAITASYAASKSGINSLTKSLALSLQKKKIRVNSIAPGWVETPMIEGNGDVFLKKVADINPLGRNGKPIDIAKVMKFLLSQESDYINGQVISVEGGYTNQDPTLLLEEEVNS